ncbi:E3 ubiquitin-protein ligase znrf2-like isoform X2 [Pomacea canaliculata]|uniref:E3 ubiquitin-protein ligase znrf2-like isoform X2 n=1 Tax=Pomacea canaliculata TaxID=400727 RepID=UPI000D73C6C6|nr:E3 ubiquitin-protein ligase znrf2-like isoform X2 [Pomacea canaliculata]
MGLKLSSQNPPRLRTYSGSSPGPSGSNELALSRNGGPGSSGGARTRARSLGNFPTPGHSSTLSIPGASGGVHRSNSPDSDSSTPEDGVFGRAFAHSLPVHLFALQGIKCPVCSKAIAADDVECHLVMCLTKPRISYNEDVLTEDKGECVICFEDLSRGDTIARLPCLCIYHKGCIDKWFEKNRSCPEHPGD